MTEIRCTKCGAVLEKGGEQYACPACGARYEERRAEGDAAALAKLLDVQKQEAVANLRQQLWREFNEEYIDREKLSSAARKIRTYLPDDFFATFCELACGRDQKKLNAFLNQIDVAAHAGDVADVVRFMLKIVRRANLLALNDLLERARGALGQDFYNKYYPVLARESEKLDEEVYNPSLPRDAFILYSSADMPAVSELVDALEGEDLKCFVAARNIRHGFASDYENILHRAMDSCKVAVYVSTSHSRSTECDALKVEMEYIRRQDMSTAPAQYRADYAKLPRSYKKPRVEYVAEAYSGKEIERVMKELFAGFERCNSVRDVVRQVIELERGAGGGAEQGARGSRGKKSLFSAAKEPVTAVDGAENAGDAVQRAVDAGRGIAAERPQGEGAPAQEKRGWFARKKKPAPEAAAASACEEKGEAVPLAKRPALAERSRYYPSAALCERAQKYLDVEDYARAVPLLRQADEDGNNPAQCELGLCYLYGRGVQKDEHAAFEFFQEAAPSDIAARDLLALCYGRGIGTERDPANAAQWFEKGADGAEAQYLLGQRYERGDCVERDPVMAVEWYFKATKREKAKNSRAAEKGCAEAMYRLGVCYEAGIGVPKNGEQAHKWYAEAYKAYEERAKKRDARAHFILGSMQEEGKGCEKDLHAAFGQYWNAASAGEQRALRALRGLYSEEVAVASDRYYTLWIKWLKKLVRKGSAAACYQFAMLYGGMKGGTKYYYSPWRRRRWLGRAAALGDVRAKWDLRNKRY